MDNYNTYLRFGGETGIQIDDTVSNLQSYTLSVWFKTEQNPWDIRKNMDIITVRPGFRCQLQYRERLQCDSDKASSSFTLIGTPLKNNWYILTIRARPNFSSIQLRELSTKVLNKDEVSKFYPFGYDTFSFTQITIGIDTNLRSNGFEGNIRNLKIFSDYYEDTIMLQTQFTFVHPFQNLVVQMLMNDVNEFRNEASRAIGRIVGRAELPRQIDYMGNVECYFPGDVFQSFLKFGPSQSPLKYVLPTSQFSSTSNYFTTLQLWFKRSNTAVVDTSKSLDEIVFNHVNVIKVLFKTQDYDNIRIEGLTYNQIPAITKVSFNRWYFIQVISTPSQLTVSLFEADGQQIPINNPTYPLTLRISSRDIFIGENFNGFIQGIKYYKTQTPPVSTIYAMKFGFDQSTDCLLYFLFNQQGMADASSFANFAFQSRTQSIGTDSNLQFSEHFLREYGSGDLSGTINQPLSFDGYTCTDNKERLYMNNQQSYARTTVSLNHTLTNYTIEFWVKPTQQVNGDTYFMALQETGIQRNIHTHVMQNSDRSLNCYANTNQTIKVAYLDYLFDLRTWIHISCVIDAPRSITRGSIYFNKNDYVYYNDLPRNFNLPKQDYNLYINTDPKTLRNGISNAYYSELRFWSFSRSIQQIQNNRFHQLDIVVDRPSLYSYAKMMSGGVVANVQDVDYADFNLQRTVSYNEIRWIQDTDLVLCPLGMYLGDDRVATCHREGIIQLQTLVYKNHTHYFVSPYFTKYRNNFLRNNARTFYDYQWNLDKMVTNNSTNTQVFPSYLNAQQTQQVLTFNMGQVSDRPGKYDLSLTVQDKNKFQDQKKQSVKFRTYKCANIFDRESKESLVYKDMDTKKGVDDAVFSYEFSDCEDYRFDQSAMTFSIDQSISLFSRDHNLAAKTFTIKNIQQTNLPINEYFFLTIKGVWRNTQSSSDTIEYHLIYACRYISKLGVKLFPNFRNILLGQPLVINFDAQYYNMKESIANKNYTIEWECPGLLNNYCKNQGNQLRLNYDWFPLTGLDYWQPYDIKLIARTNFIQGDGTKETNTTVKITWLNINPDARLIQPMKVISKEQQIGVQTDIQNIPDNLVEISWIVSPVLNRDCFTNSIDRQQLVISTSCMQEGQRYDITGNIHYSEFDQVIWTGKSSLQIPVSPSRGRVSCTRTSGRAFLDIITCSASGWTIPSSPARYQFFITDINTDLLVPISGLSSSTSIQTVLPPTRRVTLKVVDNANGIAYSTQSVSFSYTYSEEVESRLLNNLNTAFNSRNSFSPNMMNNLIVVSSALKEINAGQSSTLDYQALYRNISEMIYSQSLNFNRFSFTEQRSFIQGAVQTFSHMTTNISNFDTTTYNLIQDSLILLIQSQGQQNLEHLIYDQNFQKHFFSVQDNILGNLKTLQNQGNITTSLMDDLPVQDPALANVTIKMRRILGEYENFIAYMIFEGQTFAYNTTGFQFKIKKFSRRSGLQIDQKEHYPDGTYTSYNFPLDSASQPSGRQSFSVINFKNSPFIGDYYLNQSATSQSSIFFAYRDTNGRYLASNTVPDRISITFKYNYSPFEFLPNITTCGYININDANWENKSCNAEFNRRDSLITCHCRHMSYYSIIDDYLIRPNKYPVVILVFRNWASFFVFLYVILVFVIGTIYTFNKDNQDFRYLHEQEEQQGNVMSSDNALTIVSLAFKRKVFFMTFAEQYKFSNLIKIYIMMLHPLFQLKYKLDPETPRFYKFLMLYSRLVLLFGLSFWLMRDVQNFEELTSDPTFGLVIFETFIFILLGSFLLVPMPIILLCCCRSRYYLVDPKAPSRAPSDNEDGIDGDQLDNNDRVTDIMIDTTIPIKLLFLINAHKVDDIIKDYRGKLNYATGEISEVGKKLFELDADIQMELAQQKNKEDNKDQKKVKQENEGDAMTQQNLKETNRNSQRDSRKSEKNNLQREIGQNRGSKQESQENDLQADAIDEGPDFNKPLHLSPKKQHRQMKGGYDSSANKTDQNLLDINEIKMQIQDDEENMDEEIEESKTRDIKHEGGEPEMTFNQNGVEKNQEGEEFSDQDSIDTQLFTDEKKELVEEPNRIGKLFGNTLALCFNLGIIISVFAIFIDEGYYDVDNQYIWVIVFFGAQIVSIFITDILVLFIVALCITKCMRKKKVCLAKWMRESLYVYEDYKFVVQFANTKIQ